MDALPVMAGLITAAGLILLVFSMIAYRRTGMNRMLVIGGIPGVLFIKGILLLLGIWNIVDTSYETMAGFDLLMAFVLLGALFGKE